ncbi:MAG: haloacid dehalogenase [Actinomycetota bacterium]|nr:haloacid dehalogenase [Actinomycetota bacterium]
MDLRALTSELQRRFDEKMAAREAALTASRRAIRSSANAIRAIHRGEVAEAHRLMDEARDALDRGLEAVTGHPDIYHAGYFQDAQKEYAEARLTEAVVLGGDIPGPDELGVEPAPYLGGMSEAIGEARRSVLDLLRAGDATRSEALLAAMEDLYAVLVSMDYPDAVTGHLRRSTDVARSILEKTRGDLSLSLVQRQLTEALERHADHLHGDR